MQILDIASAKEYVLIDLVASGDLYPVLLPPFGSKRPHVAQADAGLLGVDVVEDALVPDLALGGEADEAPEIRLRGRRPGRRRLPRGRRGGGGGGRGGRLRRGRFGRHGRMAAAAGVVARVRGQGSESGKERGRERVKP